MNTSPKKFPFDDRLLLVTGSIVLLLTVTFRLSLLNLPIDRDEGEFAYAGWRMLNGGIPYVDFYNMKMPGIYAFYSLLFLFFGSTVEAIRTGLILVNLANATLIFGLAKKWSEFRTGIYAAVCYLVFSIQVELQGTSTHAEHVAMLFILSGFYFFTSAVPGSRSRLFWSGVLLGTGFVVKQPAAVYIVLAIILLFTDKFRKGNPLIDFVKDISFLLAGALLPFIVTTLLLFIAGAGKSYFLFAFQYASEYVSYQTISDGINNFNIILSKAMSPNLFMWLLVPAGSVVLFFQRKKSGAKQLLFFIFSFIAVSAGYYFRPHYFQFLIPASSLLAAAALVAAEKFFRRENNNSASGFLVPFGYLLFFMTFYVYNQRSLFSTGSYDSAIRKIYGQDFFNATKKAGEFVAKHSSENSTVAIFGAEPEIWFYSKRKAASGYLYVYPLIEHQKFASEMRRQFYDEIRKNKPDILVYTSNAGTWYADNKVQEEMVEWYRQYRESAFKRIGLINIPYDAPTTYDWSGDTTVSLINENYIEICVRNQFED